MIVWNGFLWTGGNHGPRGPGPELRRKVQHRGAAQPQSKAVFSRRSAKSKVNKKTQDFLCTFAPLRKTLCQKDTPFFSAGWALSFLCSRVSLGRSILMPNFFSLR